MKPFRNAILLSIALLFLFSEAIVAQDKYFVGFSDKIGSPYSISNPEAFLTAQSVLRRTAQNIIITERDLPVNSNYVTQVAATGAKVLYPLKWFNGIVVEVQSASTITAIYNLPFVESIIKIFDALAVKSTMGEEDGFPVYRNKFEEGNFYNYGSSLSQIKIMEGNSLHNKGFRGKGISIAILDAGFNMANTLPAFDSLWYNNRIVFSRDLVNRTSSIFSEHSHGMMVLSVLGGNIPELLIGSAPEANYMLIRTEDANSEQLIEEYNWAAGAELADSLGADIINSSLGYYVFDVPEQNYTYSQLNGTTTISAKAANIAFETGMLVINSAGNEGDNEWQYIITPADAFGSLAIGAIDSEGIYAAFSSIGPSADGRIKPDVVAMGKSTVIQRLTGEVGSSNGTSFSAPLISGMAACLWQLYSNATAAELRQLIIECSTLYSNPNNLLGYGVPQFSIYADSVQRPFLNSNNSLNIFPNPADNTLKVWVPSEFSGKNAEIQILSTLGKLEYSHLITCNGEYINFELPKSLVNGNYILTLRVDEIVKTGKFLKAAKNGG